MKEINFPSKTDDWKTFEKINSTIALNILYIFKKQIFLTYILEITSNCEKQIILLMIPNEGKDDWHYVAVKKTICIIKKNNIKPPQRFLLFKFSSFFCEKKQT